MSSIWTPQPATAGIEALPRVPVSQDVFDDYEAAYVQTRTLVGLARELTSGLLAPDHEQALTANTRLSDLGGVAILAHVIQLNGHRFTDRARHVESTAAEPYLLIAGVGDYFEGRQLLRRDGARKVGRTQIRLSKEMTIGDVGEKSRQFGAPWLWYLENAVALTRR